MNILFYKIKSENFFLLSIICLFIISTFQNYFINYFNITNTKIIKYFFLLLVFIHLLTFIRPKNMFVIAFFLTFFLIKLTIFDNPLIYEIRLFFIILLFYLIYVKINSKYESNIKNLSIFLCAISFLIITSQYISKIQPIFHFFIYYWPDNFSLMPYLNFPLFANKNHLSLIVVLNYCLIITIILNNLKNFNKRKLFNSINKNHLFLIIYSTPYLFFYTNIYSKLIVLSFGLLIIIPKIYFFFIKKKVIIFTLTLIFLTPIIYKKDFFIKSIFLSLDKINDIILVIYDKQKPFSCYSYIHELDHYKAREINKTLCIKKNLYGSPQNFAWTTLQSVAFRVSYSNTYLNEILSNSESLFFGLNQNLIKDLENHGIFTHNSYFSIFIRFGIIFYFLSIVFIYKLINSIKIHRYESSFIFPLLFFMLFDAYLFGFKIEFSLIVYSIILAINKINRKFSVSENN